MPRPSCPPAPVVAPTVLDALARRLALAHADRDGASLVRVRPGPTSVEVALRSVPPELHPADVLVGHVVPGRWSASGVVARARARRLDDGDDPGTGVAIAVLVGRDGHLAHHLAAGPDGGDAPRVDEPPTGRLTDLLRRSLGLATDPPTEPAAAWWRLHWLDRVVAAAAADPRRRADADPAPGPVLDPELVAALAADPALCGPEGWRRLHAAAARPTPPTTGPDAALHRAVGPYVGASTAAWMDVGCFSRWLLTALPPLDELLDLAGHLVAPETLRAIHHVVGTAPGHAP